jgi:glycerophosphoryl diester phosphodiesterase
MRIIAHRGASGYEPENTLAAFRRAIDMRADMIEFDVHVLTSGEVVLIHDLRVNRTTNGRGYVAHHQFEEIRRLDAGTGEVIPTLQEALEVINRQALVNIELKGPHSAEPVARILRKYLAKGWQASDFLVSSFNHPELLEFKQLMPTIDIAVLSGDVPLGYASFAEELEAVAVNPGDEFVSPEYVTDAHQRGMSVYVWTVNDPEEIERMHEIGVDGIFTNYPDVARQTIDSLAL